MPRDKVDGYYFLIQFSAQQAKWYLFLILSLSLFNGDRNRKPQAGERQTYGRRDKKKGYGKE